MRWHKFPLLVGFYLVQRWLHDLGVKKKKIKQQQQQQQQQKEHQGPLAFTKPQYFSFWETFLRKPFRKETISRSKDPKV